jgi:serine/threonine protein kinase
MDCLSDEEIVELIAGGLTGPAAQQATAHLDACADCRALVADAARGGPGERPLVRGDLVGRYVLLDPVGSGTMGTVHAAFDPELDRKVAIKVLRADALAPAGPRPGAGERLLAEAQALARLSHPNVVTVFDVGRAGDGVFVAMEFVEGVTLTSWLHERRRGWREVLHIFLQAGRGLAAAHEAGIVHRDFKPENVPRCLKRRCDQS